MALKGSCSVLLLPLVLLGAWLAIAQPLEQENDNFLLKHWDDPRSEDMNGTYCDAMMRRRELYGQANNTFIHAPVGSINSICTLGGQPGLPNERHSVAAFDITVCAFNSSSRAYDEMRYRRRIVLACMEGLAVGYVRHI
ncbi:ribonuclease-like [Carettochelys insculpta]|uniref:ribonuclease-like n=1 Tax=Carettochelys insculpta TaxID=44489 RepID=UPI003EBD5978